MPMEFRRYYASNLWGGNFAGGRLSENWSHNYEWRLETGIGASGDQVRIVDYQGREYVFAPGLDVPASPQLELVSPSWANVGLLDTGIGHVFFDRETGRRYGFGPASGPLAWIEDRNGNRHTLIYNQGYLVSIIDGLSGQIQLRYTATGKLETAYVEKSQTLGVTYGYEDGVLTSVTAPSGSVTRYTYENQRNLTGIEFGSGTVDAYTPRTWEYDAEGRISGERLAGGGSFTYTYGDATTVRQPDTGERVYRHGENGELVRFDSALGNVSLYAYDLNGLPETVIDAAGREYSFIRNLTTKMLVETVDPGNHSTHYEYETAVAPDGADFHDLSRIIWPNESTTEYGTDANGNIDLVIDPVGNTWLFDIDDAGNVVRAENPLGGATTYEYFIDGNLRSVTYPNGTRRQFSYDEFLRLEIDQFGTRSTERQYSNRFSPDRIIDRSGSTFDYEYDFADRVRAIDRSDSYFEIFTFDAAGRLESVERPDSQLTVYVYDQFGRPVSITSPDMGSQQLSYDSDSRITGYTDAAGNSWAFAYDSTGRLASVTRPTGEVLELGYDGDARGLLTSIMDGGEAFRFTYDAQHNLLSTTDPFERVDNFDRDEFGRIRRIVSSVDNVTRVYGYNAFGQVASFTNPAGGITQQQFGNDGLLDSYIGASGNAVALTRDAENRASGFSYADGLQVDVSYAMSGVPDRIQASDGTDVAIDSNSAGQVVGGTNLVIDRRASGKVGNNNGFIIEADANDRVRRMSFSDGRFVEYEYNDKGDVIMVRDWLDAVTVITPTAVGKVDLMTFPNGIMTDYDYDRATRITEITIGGLGSITVNRGLFGRVESVDRTLPQPVGIAFPSEDRRFGYTGDSQLDSAQYDVRGNFLSDGERIATWDALNRMTGLQNAEGNSVIAYDALGNITRVATTGKDRTYVQNYALDKPRISIERDAGGNDLWYYVHTVKGRLLYRINPAGERQFYHFDENGNTVLMTDDSGAVIQSYFIAPHGETLAASGNIDNDRVAYAEFGGLNIGGRDTISLRSTYIDTKAGHFLSETVGPDDLEPTAKESGLDSRRSLTVGRRVVDDLPGAAGLPAPGLNGRIAVDRAPYVACEICDDYCDTCWYDPGYADDCSYCLDYEERYGGTGVPFHKVAMFAEGLFSARELHFVRNCKPGDNAGPSGFSGGSVSDGETLLRVPLVFGPGISTQIGTIARILNRVGLGFVVDTVADGIGELHGTRRKVIKPGTNGSLRKSGKKLPGLIGETTAKSTLVPC
ncbi:MAG: DUF6531 domain-containing protein [Woeseiaceae bacterium]|nr:DUF6531 domain-containing protein [Woeseiaceae bacterium]